METVSFGMVWPLITRMIMMFLLEVIGTDAETLDYVDGFKTRHPLVADIVSSLVIKSSASRGSALAQQIGETEIILYQNFWSHYSRWGTDGADWVLMHEIGHAVSTRVGYNVWHKIAETHGVDVWDAPKLPFGQFQFEEAFAECFAVIYCGDRRGVLLLQDRYPGWYETVRETAQLLGIK